MKGPRAKRGWKGPSGDYGGSGKEEKKRQKKGKKERLIIGDLRVLGAHGGSNSWVNVFVQ